ncbi:unnamed protein product, partial [Gadus morhua 'NCC']
MVQVVGPGCCQQSRMERLREAWGAEHCAKRPISTRNPGRSCHIQRAGPSRRPAAAPYATSGRPGLTQDAQKARKTVLGDGLRRAGETEQTVCVLEEGRRSLQEEASTLRSTLRQLERARMQCRRELQELRRQVTPDPITTDTMFLLHLEPYSGLGNTPTVKVLRGGGPEQPRRSCRRCTAGCPQEEQKEEEARREAFTLKQRVVECEAGKRGGPEG